MNTCQSGQKAASLCILDTKIAITCCFFLCLTFISRVSFFPLPLMQVESTSIGWSLGYMLTMSNMIPSDVKKIPPMTDPLFAGLIFLFSALTIVTVVFVFIIIIRTCYWGRTPPTKGRQPQATGWSCSLTRSRPICLSWTQKFAGLFNI